MTERLAAFVERLDRLPLSWAGGVLSTDCLNFGDALSPVMAALVSGLPVQRIPFRSQAPRLAAVGTIGQSFVGGAVHIWGTGCSQWTREGQTRRPYGPPADTQLLLHATRGPYSEYLLSGGKRPWGGGVYGDPAWLLPRFYRPPVGKRRRLGVVLHLSELQAQKPGSPPLDGFRRYDVPAALRHDVALIDSLTAVGAAGLKDKIDEIVACERIVSTSLHGMVIAEAYGIPCLYFALEPPRAGGPRNGPGLLRLDPAGPFDSRIVDFYGGFGATRRAVYFQDRDQSSDWEAVAAAVDRFWEPLALDEERLLQAFPLPASPLRAAAGTTIWEHPVLQAIAFKEDVGALRRLDRDGWGAAPG